MINDLINGDNPEKENKKYLYIHSRLKKSILLLLGLTYFTLKSCNYETSESKINDSHSHKIYNNITNSLHGE